MMSEEQYLTLAEVKDILEKEQKKREFTVEQKYALVHTQQFAKLSAKDARKLVKELTKFEMLNEMHACKLADILPHEPEEVRAIFAKERFILEPETIEEILEIIRKYL